MPKVPIINIPGVLLAELITIHPNSKFPFEKHSTGSKKSEIDLSVDSNNDYFKTFDKIYQNCFLDA